MEAALKRDWNFRQSVDLMYGRAASFTDISPKLIEKIYTELLELLNENPSKFCGCIYLFKCIVYNASELEVYLNFDFNFKKFLYYY